jgi:4-hydroxybenzoate polyprenyltransferase
MSKLFLFVRLIRPQQWVKNLFLFVPLFFAGDFFHVSKLINLFFGLVSFSLVSSAAYILNDFRDIEADKIHPVKKYRPLASGRINPAFAIFAMFLLMAAGLISGFLVSPTFGILLIIYLIINVLYSFGLKNVSIIDILIVATGFVLRILAGGFIAAVFISHWLVIMVFLLSLFLVVAKRRADLLEFNASGKMIRKSLANYNLEFINHTLTMLSGVIIVAYIMYSVSQDVIERLGAENLYMTSVFVIIGLLRYLQLTLVENRSGSPVRILYTDKFIIVTLTGWIVSFFLILYLR